MSAFWGSEAVPSLEPQGIYTQHPYCYPLVVLTVVIRSFLSVSVRLASWWHWCSPSQPLPSCLTSGAKNGRLSCSLCRSDNPDTLVSYGRELLYFIIYKTMYWWQLVPWKSVWYLYMLPFVLYYLNEMFETENLVSHLSFSVFLCHSPPLFVSLGHSTFPPCGCCCPSGNSVLANSVALLPHE